MARIAATRRPSERLLDTETGERDELFTLSAGRRPLVGVKTISGAGSGTQARPALLDIAGVAERLCVTERFIRRLVFERRIPFLKIGHFVRFEPAEIERWIAQTRVPEDSRR